MCLVWQVGKEVLTQRPFLLASAPLLMAASSRGLCPAPVFLTCFLSLFLLTALGLLLGTGYAAKMCLGGGGGDRCTALEKASNPVGRAMT